MKDAVEKILTLLDIPYSDDPVTAFVEKFDGSVRSLLDLKQNKPDSFTAYDSEELFNILDDLNIKGNTGPLDETLSKIDAVFVMSGQLITVVEQWLTFLSLEDKLNKNRETHLQVFPMHMMAKYPDKKQEQLCLRLIEERTFFEKRTDKWTKNIWESYSFKKPMLGSVKGYLPCVNRDELVPLISRTISASLPDAPLNILVITAQPKEHEKIFSDYFEGKHNPHKFHFAKNTTPEFEIAKGKYFGDTLGMTVRFMLRDLAAELKELIK